MTAQPLCAHGSGGEKPSPSPSRVAEERGAEGRCSDNKGPGTQPRTQRAQMWWCRPHGHTLHRYADLPPARSTREICSASLHTLGRADCRQRTCRKASFVCLLSGPPPCSVWVPTVKSRNEKIHKKDCRKDSERAWPYLDFVFSGANRGGLLLF